MFDNSARIILPNKQKPRVFTTAAKITLNHASSNFDYSIVGVRLVFIVPKVSFLHESFIIKKLVLKEMIISQARGQIRSFKGCFVFSPGFSSFFKRAAIFSKSGPEWLQRLILIALVRSPWCEDV